MPGIRVTDEDHQNIDKRFFCSVCNFLLVEPMQTYCGHLMCLSCVQPLLESSDPKCPEDATALKKDQMFPDVFTKREIKRLTLRCPNPGCSWFGSYDDLGGHSRVCEYELIDCDHPQCGIKVVRCNLSEHLHACEYRRVRCEYCRNDVIFALKTEHIQNSCECAPVSCRHCNEHVLRKDIETHERVLCEDVQTTCNFSRIGCNKRIKRKYLDQHLKDGLSHHARLMISYLPNLISQIRNEVDHAPQLTLQLSGTGQGLGSSSERTRRQDELNECMLLLTKLLQDLIVQCEDAEQTLKDAMSLIPRVENRLNQPPSQSVHSYNGLLKWKIDGYQRKREDAINGVKTALYSKPFYTEEFGYKMCAKIYMNGDGPGKGTHLSLFIVVMKGEYDHLQPWPFRKNVTMVLVNQGNGDDMTDEFQSDPHCSSFQRPVSDMNIASGLPLFVSLDSLDNRQYIKDDVMFVKIIVD